eukprot:TRINITY_DN8259_c0_g2_i1.p2 TRINITY_DN8259_c0_g2~~TRINITY_DN8259_c0_g2_i1.p2  ORF type:complete len:211 (-),score=75.25 TRINITY_DN8259_c0_g2_i1:284-916(-)
MDIENRLLDDHPVFKNIELLIGPMTCYAPELTDDSILLATYTDSTNLMGFREVNNGKVLTMFLNLLPVNMQVDEDFGYGEGGQALLWNALTFLATKENRKMKATCKVGSEEKRGKVYDMGNFFKAHLDAEGEGEGEVEGENDITIISRDGDLILEVADEGNLTLQRRSSVELNDDFLLNDLDNNINVSISPQTSPRRTRRSSLEFVRRLS